MRLYADSCCLLVCDSCLRLYTVWLVRSCSLTVFTPSETTWWEWRAYVVASLHTGLLNARSTFHSVPFCSFHIFIYTSIHMRQISNVFFQSFSSKMNFICTQCIVNLIHYIALPESLHSTFASRNNVRMNKITNFHINVSYNELMNMNNWRCN